MSVMNVIAGAFLIVGIYFVLFGGWQPLKHKIEKYVVNNPKLKFIWEVIKDA